MKDAVADPVADREEAVPQHMRALRAANRVRLKRAEWKRELAASDRPLDVLSDTILDLPEWLESMTVADALMAQHRWGRTRMRRFLASMQMGESKTLGRLTPRQRRNLVARLNGQVVIDPLADPFAALAAA